MEPLRTFWNTATLVLVRCLTLPLAQERRTRAERWWRGKEEVRKLELADVVVVSFGKSGRTWLRVMLSRFYQIRYGLRASALLGFDNLHRRHPAIPRIFITHDNYIKDFTGHHDDKSDFLGKKIVLLVRDPRDVAVSQFFQWKFRMRRGKKALNDYPPHGAEVSMFDFAMHPGAGLPKIIDFMNRWAREFPRQEQLLVVRYEDLRRDTAAELLRILRFMGEAPRPEEVQDAVAFASVENMRQMEQKRVFWRSGKQMVAQDRSNPDSYKVRRAKVGGWRDYFTTAEATALDAFVTDHLAPGFGYRADEAPASEAPLAMGA